MPKIIDLLDNVFFTIVVILLTSIIFEFIPEVSFLSPFGFFASGVFSYIYVKSLVEKLGLMKTKSTNDNKGLPIDEMLDHAMKSLKNDDDPVPITKLFDKKTIMVSDLDHEKKKILSKIIAEDIFTQFLDSDLSKEFEIDVEAVHDLQKNNMIVRVDLRLPKSPVLSIPSYVRRRKPDLKKIYPEEERMANMEAKKKEEIFDISTTRNVEKTTTASTEPSIIEDVDIKPPSKPVKQVKPPVIKARAEPTPIKISFMSTGDGDFKAIVSSKKQKEETPGIGGITEEELKAVWEDDDNDEPLDPAVVNEDVDEDDDTVEIDPEIKKQLKKVDEEPEDDENDEEPDAEEPDEDDIFGDA